MKKPIVKIIAAFAVLGLICGSIAFFAPQSAPGKAIMGVVLKIITPKKRDASTEKGIEVTAAALGKEYAADEKASDAKYLNKNIEVSGTVSETEKNQDGGMMIVLGTDDPMTGVQCTMKDKNANATKGQAITIKGFCSGNSITGVSLTDCVIK